jgi:hypothetical protein
VRSEFLLHEFSFRASERTHYSAVSVDTDSNVVGLHHLMSKSSRLDHLQEALLLDDSSVGIDDDPVIGNKSFDRFWIIFTMASANPSSTFKTSSSISFRFSGVLVGFLSLDVNAMRQ